MNKNLNQLVVQSLLLLSYIIFARNFKIFTSLTPEVNIPPENEVCDEGQDTGNAICDYLVEQDVI